jgi:ribonuclease HI
MGNEVVIYTDGAASGNPGPGGYGVVMLYKGHEKTMAEGFKRTTNNRMELLAVIVAMEAMKTPNLPIRVYSDSKYVVDAIEQGWLMNWERKAFKKTKNPDLWMRFLRVYRNFNDIKFNWVKGHANDPLNEKADRLAVEASKAPDLKTDFGYDNPENTIFNS